MFKRFALAVLLSGVLPTLAAAQSALGVVCLGKTGKIFVRTECLSGETKASLSDLTKKGLTGNPGPTGSSGGSGRTVSFTDWGLQEINQSGKILTQACSAGRVASGGGCYASNASVVVNRSYPDDGAQKEWSCKFVPRAGLGSASAQVNTYVICIDE